MLNYKNYLFNAETQKTRPDPISFAKIKKRKIFVIIFSEIMYYFKEKKRGVEGWMK